MILLWFIHRWGREIYLSIPPPALNSFLDPPIEIPGLDVVGGVPQKLNMDFDIVLQNPSIIYGSLGDFTLDLFFQGEVWQSFFPLPLPLLHFHLFFF